MKRLLFVLVGLLLLGSMSGAVYAVTDVDDSLLDPYEIVAGDVVIFEPVITEPGAKYARVSLTMDGKLPGALMLEMNVDNDTGTGGNGMHNILAPCQGGPKIAPAVPGTDFSIYLVLDAQSSASSSAWCSGCTGPAGLCFYKTTQCDTGIPCGTANCYKGEVSCFPYDLNCFVAGDMCQPEGEPDCDLCFEMVEDCTSEASCAYGMLRGEYYVAMLDPPQQKAPFYARGRLEMPLPPQGGPNGTETGLCITLPYSSIISTLKGAGAAYDDAAALNPSNVSWHMSAWEDGAVGGIDHLNADTFCAEIVDIIPNSGDAPVKVHANPAFKYDQCGTADYDQDGDCKDGPDIAEFKATMGRSGLFDPCPSIICP